MHLALAVADVVVGRSGAGTVCELAALGIPAVYVPLPIGNGEQRLNAAAVVAAGGGLLVDDDDLDPAWIRAHLPVLLVGDAAAETRERMGARRRERRCPRRRRPGRPARRGGAAVTAPSARGRADLGRVHLVGVGGAGMSAIAALLAARGVVVSGSDAADGPALPGAARGRRRRARRSRRRARRRRRHARRLVRRPGDQPRARPRA